MRFRPAVVLLALSLASNALAACAGSGSSSVMPAAMPIGGTLSPSARVTGTPPPLAPPPGTNDCATLTAGTPSTPIDILSSSGQLQTNTITFPWTIRSCGPTVANLIVNYDMEPRVTFGTCAPQTFSSSLSLASGAQTTLNLKIGVPNCGTTDSYTITASVLSNDANTPTFGTNGVQKPLSTAQESFEVLNSLPGLVNNVQTLAVTLVADPGADPTAVSGMLVYKFDGTHMSFSGQPTLPAPYPTGIAILVNGQFFQGSSVIGDSACTTTCGIAAFPSAFDAFHTFSPTGGALPADPTNVFIQPGDKVDIYTANSAPPSGASFAILNSPLVLGQHLAGGVMALPPGGLGGGGAH